MRRTRASGRTVELLVLAMVLEVLFTAVVARIRRTLLWSGFAIAAAILMVAGTVAAAVARPTGQVRSGR